MGLHMHIAHTLPQGICANNNTFLHIIYIYIHLHTCTYIYIYIYTYGCIRTHICMYKYVCIHVYIYIYIYIHIHTHAGLPQTSNMKLNRHRLNGYFAPLVPSIFLACSFMTRLNGAVLNCMFPSRTRYH